MKRLNCCTCYMRAAAKIFLLLILSTKYLYAQRCDTATFQSRYWVEGKDAEYVTRMIAKTDGNIYIVNAVTDTGMYAQDYGDVCVTKLTQKGTVLWSKKIGYEGSFEWPFDATQTSDGGFIICGSTNEQNPNGDAWLVKLDANAAVQWSTTFTPIAGIASSISINTIELSDGGYAVIGYFYLTFDSRNLPTSGAAFVARTDKDGKIIWSKNLMTNKEINDFTSVKELHDGNLVLLLKTQTVISAYRQEIIYMISMQMELTSTVLNSTSLFIFLIIRKYCI